MNFELDPQGFHRRLARFNVARVVFGWNFPYRIGLLPPAVLALMQQAGMLMVHADGQQHSAVRVAALGADWGRSVASVLRFAVRPRRTKPPAEVLLLLAT